MASVDTSGLSGDALKAAEGYNRAMQKAEKSMKSQEKLVGQISSSFLGIGGNEFFRNLTTDEYNNKMTKLRDEAKGLQSDAAGAADKLDSSFNSILEGSNLSLASAAELSDRLNITGEAAEKIAESFKNAGEEGVSVSGLIKDMGEYGDDLVKAIVDDANLDENLVKPFKDAFDELGGIDTKMKIVNTEMNNAQESVFDLAKGMRAVGENLTKSFQLTSLMSGLMKFDSVIKKAQIDTGINFTQNASSMAVLTSETARFGMSVENTTALMGELGKEMRTSNFEVLKDAVEDVAAIGKATGLAAADTAKLTKEYAMFGQSTKDVADMAAGVMNEAVAYGVNGKEIMQVMASKMGEMRRMGFTGGEQSLKRMALESKRLGMNVDDIFATGKRARNIEGAMKMAAELQLAGGSFAAIDPMQLLSAARKGPAEMQKILGKMGADVGAWVKDKDGNEKYEFDPVDADRLQMVSEATGQSLDSLQNMIAKNAEDNKKLNLLPPSMFGVDMTDEEKAFLMNATKIGENGKLEMAAEIPGIDSLADLQKMGMEEAMALQATENKSIEERAQQNMSFQETKDAFMASITNLFSVFQPLLQILTNFINYLNGAPTWLKATFGILIGALTLLFGPAKSFMQGFQMGRGINAAMAGSSGFFGKIKGFFKKGGGGGGLPGTKDIAKTSTDGGAAGGAASKSGGGLKGLATGLKSMGRKGVLKGILAVALAGPALLMFLPAIPGLYLMAGLGAMAPMLAAGFQGVKTGFSIMGGALKSIAKGALAMALIGLSILPFAYAAQIMSEVDWLNVLAGVGVMALVVLGLVGLGFLMTFALPFLLLGALGLVIAGGGLLVGALLLQAAIEPLQTIADVDWSAILPFASVMSTFGWSLIGAGIGLMIGAYGLAVAAPLLAMSIAPLQELAGTDWTPLKGFADAIGYVGPAMLGFAAAGLLMFNPLMLLGMVTMLGAIAVLNTLMGTLGPNLQEGADGIERMAEGVVKLEEAVSKINMEKLSSLKDVMSNGDGAVKFVEAMRGIQSATSGGGGGGGGGEPIRHIVVLELDGKKLKEIELRDTKHLS